MKMRSPLLMTAVATLGLGAFIARAEAKKAATVAATPAAASNGFQTDFLALLDDVQKKILSLEDAIPQDKFKWRPGPGVRSVSEAFLHIAYGNYGFTKGATGQAPAADVGWGMDHAKWDAKTTDKAEIKKTLEASFDQVRAAMKDVTDTDLDKKVNVFGHDMTERAVWMALLGHLNEHMGQEVAYARANNVVPPWSVPKGG